jgi:hypothetical protein
VSRGRVACLCLALALLPGSALAQEAPPAGEARVTVRPDGTLFVQLNGPTVQEAVSELAMVADVAIKVDEEVGTAHHLYISFTAEDGEDALRKLGRLGELSVQRQTVAGESVLRIGPHRQIFAMDLWHLLSAAVLLLLALLFDRLLEAFLRRQERSSRRGAARLKQVVPMLRVGGWLFAGLSAFLMLLSVPPSTALALTGGGLLVLGFASKEFAANILSRSRGSACARPNS